MLLQPQTDLKNIVSIACILFQYLILAGQDSLPKNNTETAVHRINKHLVHRSEADLLGFRKGTFESKVSEK
jgi:hypothetical protein